MNKWNKILSDTDSIQHLKPDQRFWRCLAFLRLHRIDEAQVCLDQGGLDFKNEARNQLLKAEILISKKQQRDADTLLCQIWPFIKGEQKLLTSWTFCSQRLHQPSPDLVNLLQRQTRSKLNVEASSHEEWQRIMKLAQFQSSFEAYLEWLTWDILQDKTNTLTILNLLFEHCHLRFQELKLLTQFFKSHQKWEILINKLFFSCTQIQQEPLNLWKNWHQSFPREYRPKLIKAMKQYISKHPSFDLEEFIEQYAPRS